MPYSLYLTYISVKFTAVLVKITDLSLNITGIPVELQF